jgi:hypothetical protein
MDAGVPADTVENWLSRRGLPAAGHSELLDLATRCARVWRLLPAPDAGRTLLTVLAASALDDPHALDRGSPVATALLRLLGHEPPDSAEAWRFAWDEHGIDCDPVSSRVLVMNLRLCGDAACARLTEAAGSEPLWLTWRSLSGTFRIEDPEVFVCENPSVLIAAADELGNHGFPLVCTNGRPSAAAMRLLTGIAQTGAVLRVRADDDAAGQEIVSGIMRAIPSARLWRFTLRDPVTPRYEEQDIDVLLRDLRRNGLAACDGASGLLCSDPLDQTPHATAGIRTRRRPVEPVLLLQLLRANSRLIVVFSEPTKRCGCGYLAAAEHLGRHALHLTPVDKRVLILEMQQKPQLYARIRHGNVDAVIRSQFDGILNFRMLVDVEDTPVLVVGVAASTACLTKILRPCRHRLFDNPQWGSVKWVNGDDHPLAVQAVPMC